MPTKNPENAKDIVATPLDVVMTAAYPSMVTGVARKINTGNYENMDIIAGLAIPVFMTPNPDELEVFKEACQAAAELGFAIVSKETGERYNAIKDLQRAR